MIHIVNSRLLNKMNLINPSYCFFLSICYLYHVYFFYMNKDVIFEG